MAYARPPRLLLVGLVAAVSLIALPAAGQTAKPEPLPAEHPLARLQFANHGIVRSDMQFQERMQPCYYVESPAAWSVSWGGPSGGASYPYLGLVDRRDAVAEHPRQDVLFDDFENGRFDRWSVEGEAFGSAPLAVETVRFNAPIRGHQGKYVASSFPHEGQDRLRGKLTSRPLVIERRFLKFLIAGGTHPDTCMSLLVGGKVVRTASGDNSHVMTERCWDVAEFQGRQAVLQITDDHSGGWGHVLVDRILFTDSGGPRLLAPPLGMRSAVPLGGLGAGTVELRADGSFHDWNIFNNSPGGGGGKMQLDDALLAVRVRPERGPSRAWAVRTHPPHGLPAIAEIDYSGAFPVSRLRLNDPHLPLSVAIYAYSELKIRDARASASPAVVFSFLVANRSSRPVEASFLFSLPNAIRGAFSSGRVFRLDRGGNEPTSGSMVLRFGDGLPCSWAVGDLPQIWQAFAETGRLPSDPLGPTLAKHGAIACGANFLPGETKTVNLVLAWHFPHRTHAGNRQRVGNYYATLYKDAADVADKVLGRLPETWQALLEWQRLSFDNSLPDWLQDALVNSLATMAKTGMWLEDGRWRQWESFSCAAVDPVHIHFYRSLPYVLLFPELQKSQFRGYASIQKPDGFVNEDLGNAGRPMDDSAARAMGDCTSTFILGVYKHYLWTADRKLLDELWPHARKAAQWQIDRSRRFGLPERLNNTYDWWAFDEKDVVAYNAVLHLAALRAAARLAGIEGDEQFASKCEVAFEAARGKIDELLWTGTYYRAWYTRDSGQTEALHADTLYGQLWACMLGLGWLVDPDKARAHLAAEMKYNGSPFGLKVMQRRGHEMVDDLVWEAGSLDWAALNLYLGGDSAASLAEAGKVVNTWREHLRDPWDWRDLTRSDNGQPWCNSHYARQLILWSIPLALSGQQYSAPAKRLSFNPVKQAPARLPWFTPQANGVLEIQGEGKYRLSTLSGALRLDELRIGGGVPAKAVSLTPQKPLDLDAR